MQSRKYVSNVLQLIHTEGTQNTPVFVVLGKERKSLNIWHWCNYGLLDSSVLANFCESRWS